MKLRRVLLLFLIFALELISLVGVHANNLYYMPDSDSTDRAYHYQKSQHKLDLYIHMWPYDKKQENVVLYTLLNGEEGEGLTHKNFKDYYTVPWSKFETKYDLAYCLYDCFDSRMEEFESYVEYKKVPINESTKIDSEEKKKALIEIIRRTYPFVSRDEMVDILLKDNVVAKKTINDKIYISTPGAFQQVNTPKFETISVDEIMLATQIAIFDTMDPGFVKNQYSITTRRGNNTIVESSGINFDTYTTKSTYNEVKLNVKTISDYLKKPDSLVGTDNELKINDVIAKKNGDHYTIYVETNRRITDTDNVNVTISKEETLTTAKISQAVDVNNNLYAVDVPNLTTFDSDVTVKLTGEYATDEVYVYESSSDTEDVPLLIGLSSTKKNINETKVIKKENIEIDPNDEEEFRNDGLYYSPPSGVGSYQKSQHQNKNSKSSSGYGNAIIHNLVKTKDFENLTISNFSRKYQFPWHKSDSSYVPVYCIDPFVDYASGVEFKRIPIYESTFITKNQTQLVNILKKSYPYISKDEMIDLLVKDGAIVKKTINGVTYYTAPENNDPRFEKITESEMILAISDAIYYYTSPNFITDIYGWTTSREYFNTTISYTDLVFDTYDESGEYEEVRNNVKAIYNWLINLDDKNNESEAALDVVNAYIEKENNDYYLKIKTNRTINKGEKLKVSLLANDSEIANYDLGSLSNNGSNTYIIKIDNLPKKSSEMSISINGNYLEDEVYVYEATSGTKSAQTLIGLQANPIKYSKTLSLGPIINPDTNSFISIGIMILCLIIIVVLLYFKKKAKFIKS